MAVVITAFALAQRYGRDPHGKEGQCRACHFDPPPAGRRPPARGAPRTGLAGYPLRYERERAVCERCHMEHNRQTHPTEVKPRMQISAGWPLDAKGRLMCSTCHDPHRARRPGEKHPSRHLLRSEEAGLRFCQDCHGKGARGDTRSWHVVVAGSAHGDAAKGEPTPPGVLDALSARCLECHDGTTARGIGIGTGRSRHGAGPRGSHPVGVHYVTSATRGRRGRKPIRLRSVAMLDKRIRLFDGKVGCGSCHDVFSRNEKFLAIETRRGNLCLACHDL